MSTLDLVFYDVATSERIFDPLLIVGSPVQVTVTNRGIEALTDLGIYLTSATTVGDVDNPADYPPETDYQDLLTWGTATQEGVSVSGGLILTVPQTAGTVTEYVRRGAGDKYSTRIPFADLAVDQSRTFTVELEAPPGLGGVRRLFVNIILE